MSKHTTEAMAWMVWCKRGDECDYRVFFTKADAEAYDDDCRCCDDDEDERTQGVIPLYALAGRDPAKLGELEKAVEETVFRCGCVGFADWAKELASALAAFRAKQEDNA